MHLSFASPAPRYPGTSEDHSQTCSLEADKSPANIHWLPRKAGHLQHRVTDKVQALIPWENPDEVLAQIPSPNDHHQATAATLYMFPTGRDVSMHKSPTISWQVPRYCPGTQGAGDTNDRCISATEDCNAWTNLYPFSIRKLSPIVQ